MPTDREKTTRHRPDATRNLQAVNELHALAKVALGRGSLAKFSKAVFISRHLPKMQAMS